MHISISSSPERMGFFRAWEMSFGDQPAGGRPIWDFVNGGFEWLAGSVGVFFAEFR